MKINIQNAAKIQTTLDGVNGKANAHTICDPAGIQAFASTVENDLKKRGLPKNLWQGIRATFSPSGPGAAYARRGRYIITTRITIERGAGAWFLVDCERRETWADARGEYRIRVNQDAIDAMRQNIFADFEVNP